MVGQVIEVIHRRDRVGAVSFDPGTGIGAFEYAQSFIDGGIELSPISMPLASGVYSFPALGRETFDGLPGLLADSLPDDFGNSILNEWAARQGRAVDELSPLEKLQYIGKRGIGALEFAPAARLKGLNASRNLELELLVEIAQEVLDSRAGFAVEMSGGGREDRDAMVALLSIGTSAGGARPKAVVAFNEDFTKVRSGQVDAPEGFTHYLLKFDGVSENRRGRESFGDPLGYGAMEFVYHKMATACGIKMMPCELLTEGDRRHFITRRFDRSGNRKIHVQTLNGLAHIDYKLPGSYSYAELFGIARRLGLAAPSAEQLLRRMVFNIVARNHDDHSKNFSFLLRDGGWELAPAYDLAYSYKPESKWTNSHWMTMSGKRDGFVREDFHAMEKLSPLFTRANVNRIIDETIAQVSQWRRLAVEHEVPAALIEIVESNLRLDL
ncbi:MAG: type II toxin-antitoxin system HipA family toxin [Gammaproteobacteria bacterium]|nr:type II toxin-antitoxin system HipA family toxin [Gammaproteobacteria bacterium]MXZ33443.1 type II toxin-antitoxin system HipA family toxin [Gammaproteobacteria bacterium]MYF00463.1 type II toxin-antitoxin system HipA family toxin [Gammaproteobacteria bacterium]MYG96115.1 type II toxin-antitoxin system HipA family toxin [Gammaproteobacteria bacterium]